MTDAVAVLTEIKNDTKNSSILAKYLREHPNAVEELASRKTKYGAGIITTTLTGHKIPSSKVGIYATDEDCFDTFHDLFTFVCMELYGLKSNHSEDAQSEESYETNFDAIKSVRVRSARNFSGYSFPAHMNVKERKEVETKVVKALKENIKGTYYPLGDLSKEERKKMQDDHFLFAEADEFLEIGGFYRDWPNGRGIFMSDDKTNIIWVNEEDHVRVIALEPGNDFNAVFKKSFGLLDMLEKSLKVAKHKDFGGLTSCPTNLGTGMRASVHVSVPNIIKKVGPDGLKELCKERNLDLRGIHGEHTGFEGDTFDVSNKRRFGLTPRTGFTEVVNGVKALLKIDQEYGAAK